MYKDKGEKYIAILEAAELIMYKEGFEGLSISKVATKAQIAKGTVYLYFENKEEIIGGLALKARMVLLDYFKKYTEAENDPIEKIKAIFWADYYYLKEQHAYHKLITFYEQNTGLKETGKLAESGYAISKFLNSIIENAMKEGVIRKDIESSMLTYTFWGMVVGILQIIETKEDQLKKNIGKTAKEFYESFIDQVLEGIIVR